MPYPHRNKIEKFVRKHMDRSEPFAGDKEAIEEARSFIGYSQNTSRDQIARILDKTLANIRKHSSLVPTTNNAGDKRRAPTFDRIMTRSRYSFNSNLVRKVFDDKGYSDFVKKYCEVLSAIRTGRRWAPTKEELEVFELFDHGKITTEKARTIMGLATTNKVMEKMGKIYAYKKENANK